VFRTKAGGKKTPAKQTYVGGQKHVIGKGGRWEKGRKNGKDKRVAQAKEHRKVDLGKNPKTRERKASRGTASAEKRSVKRGSVLPGSYQRKKK